MSWIERFETLEELRLRVRGFARTYNREWLLERHGYRSPVEARELLLSPGRGVMIALFTECPVNRGRRRRTDRRRER